MKVKLLESTGFAVAIRAAKMCYGRPEAADGMSYEESLAFLKKLIDLEHESVLEHSVFVFEVDGISRACLQELARHRHISLSVKSTRWVLKEHQEMYTPPALNEKMREFYKEYMYHALNIVENIRDEYGNDVAKYFLPEGFTTRLIITANLRQLRHMWKVRHSPKALEEFRNLMEALVVTLDPITDELVTHIKEVKKEGAADA